MIKKSRHLLSFLLVIALAAVSLGQSPSTAPSVDRLRQAVTYLASDALEGRRTGTAGAKAAANYIAAEFKRYGLRSETQMVGPTRGENQARYLQSFPYVANVELGTNNLFVVNPGRADDIAQFRVGEDWMPLGFSSNAELKNAEIVFAGYGISSAELKYDDYAVSKAKDRVAIVFAGTPDGDNPHGQFTQAGQIRFKAAAARAAGARALLIIANEDNLKSDRMARLSYDNAGEAGIPVLVISRQLARKLLWIPNPEMTLSEFEKIEADVRLVLARPKPTDSSSTSPLRRGEFIFAPGLLREPVAERKLTISVNVNRRNAPSFNVIGILPGSDPKLKDEAIVIGAHYDHLGRGGQGSLAAREGEIHHGADDNASGVAGLLELARVLSAQKPKPRRSIVFIAFSGEEEGLIGSNYYVNHPVVPLANTVAMINLDMIGRLNERKLVIGGVGTAQDWRALIDQTNVVPTTVAMAHIKKSSSPIDVRKILTSGTSGAPAAKEQFVLTLNEDGFGPSDHSSFYGKQIPVLFFWTGTHADYHKPSDTAEKINYEGEARIVSFVANIVRDVDKNDKRPTYTVAKGQAPGGRSSGFRVYLGTIPNYADSTDGLKLDGVRDDSPAAKAGLKAGDKIVKIAGRDVKNVYDYTYALGEMKGGQEYEIEVVRGSERLTLKITPEARK